MLKKIMSLLVIINLAFLLNSCVVEKEKAVVQQHYPIISYKYIPERIDVDANFTIEEENFIMLLFSGLLYEDEKGEIRSELARSWNVNEDGCEYTFILKDDAKWSDGKKIVAQDIKAFFLRFLTSENTNYIDELHCIKGSELYSQGRISEKGLGIEVVDDNVIKFILNYPNGNFPRIIAQPTFLLRNIDEDIDWKNNYKDISYSGAFRIDEIKEGYIYLVKNKEYLYDKDIVSEKLVIDTKKDENYALARIKMNMIDMMVSPYDYMDVLDTFEEDEEKQGVGIDGGNSVLIKQEEVITKEYTTIFFNLDKEKIFNDYHIRKSLFESLGYYIPTEVDFEEYKYEEVVMLQELDEADSDGEQNAGEEDVGEESIENEYLKELNGETLSILVNIQDENSLNYCKNIKEKLEELGSKVEVVYVANSSELMKEVESSNFDMCFNSFFIDDNTRGYLLKLTSKAEFNSFSYTNYEYDSILNRYFFQDSYFEKLNLIDDAEEIIKEDFVLAYEETSPQKEYILMNDLVEEVWYNERGNIILKNISLKNK